MKPPSARIRKRHAPQRKQSDSHQTISVPPRRSSRLQSRQRSISILHSLETCYKPQSIFEQRPTDLETSQPIRALSYTCLPTSDPIEASTPKPSREQLQEYPYIPQTHSHQTRKRRQDESIETNIEAALKRRRLTKKNLKAFERMVGRGRKDLKSRSLQPRNLSRFEPNSSHSEAMTKLSKTSESSSKTVSTTDSSFPRLVFENGVLDPLNSAPPENLGYLQDRLNRARDTESPTESEYQDFVYRTQEAPNEQTMLLETSKLLKEYGRGYRRVYNQALNDFPKSVGFNTGLSAPQPDMIEGLDLREFKPFPVRQELGRAAVPTSENNATTLPHLAGEWKAGGKDMIQARTQAAYDGACMVYGRNEARSFLESPDPAGHVYVQTFTTDGTTLHTFAHYSSESQDQVKYHQYPTSSSFLISSYEDFKQSRRRLRNQQDDAKETSEKLRDELNEKWSVYQHLVEGDDVEYSHQPVTIPASTDFDSYDHGDGEDPNSQLLTEYWTSFSANNEEESFVHIPPAHSVYAPTPPRLQESNLDESPVHILAADSMHAPRYGSILANNQEDTIAGNGHTSPEAITFSIITPPQSSKDVSLSLESSEGIDKSNIRGHVRARRTRTRVVDTVEEPREVDHKFNARKVRRKL